MKQTEDNTQDQEDLRLLRESAQTLFARAGGSDRARKLRDAGGRWGDGMITELAGAGVFGVAVPEENGGLGMGLAAAGVLAEEAGRVIAPEPVVATIGLTIGLLYRLCPDHGMLEKAIGGETVLATAWQERGAAGVAPGRDCRFAGGRLTGAKAWIAGAVGADGYLVVAEGDGGAVLAYAEAGAAGLNVEGRRQADGSALGELSFSATPAELLAEGAAVEAALAEAVSDTTALAAAELVGLSGRAFEIVLDYVKTREQFDKPIGAFQVIQHRATDLYVMQEVAHAAVREVLSSMDRAAAGPQARARLASRAKARAGAAAKKITRDAVQLHGAVGYTDEFDIGLFLNRALVLSAWLGDDTYHRRLWLDARDKEGGGKMTDWNAMTDENFRREVHQFFESEYPEELRHLPHRPTFAEVEHWHRKLHAKGWVAPAWPAEYGGMGLSAAKLLIFYEEQQRWGVNRGRDMGVQMVGPLIIKFGTQTQKDYWLPRILSCEDIWCQGYSEPGAGSDLANLRTRAEIDGDDFVINGQKIWTTMAHDATHIFMLVRTDPDAPKKQQGISFILAPMDQPGVEVRTIRTLAGETEFCEVFFDDARTPRANLVGELNKGWTMAKALLSFERIFIGSPSLAQNALGQLEVFARGRGAFDDPVFRDRFAQAALDVEDHAALYSRFADQLKRGETLGADVSMLKIWVTECFQRITELMIEAAGPDGGTIGPLQVGNVSVDVLASFYKARPTTIYGGSNEIQRNILSKAVLGLPG